MAAEFRDSRARRAARWLAPSAVAACLGALVGAGVELCGPGDAGGALGVVATIGFFALLATPALLLASVLARAVLAAWRPRQLAEQLVEPGGGGAPVLAAWAVIVWLAAVALAAVLFQGVWVLANNTAWKAPTVSLAVPLIAVAALLVMLAIVWPVARGLTWLLRRVHPALLQPRWIALALVALTVIVIAASWIVLISPHIGPFDTSLFVTPGAAVLAMIAAHAAWHAGAARVRLRSALGGAVCALAGAAAVCALVVAQTSPSLTLSIWGDRTFAGLAVDKLYNLDALRADVPLSELAPTVARPGAPHPDIVLVTIDTVRADHTPPYGGLADMPALRHLGETGSVFNWAFSPSNVTRRSVPSLVLGLEANRVRGRVVGWSLRVDPRHVLLAERLREGGYDTAGFMCCEGFWGRQFHTGWERGLEHLEIEKNGLELAKKAREWLDAREQLRPERPVFLWMHLLEPHEWTTVSGEGRNDTERRRFYDRSLATADQALVTVLGAFSNRAPEHAPIVIITADHGESLGEHGSPFHSTDLYDSQTHVPLVIAGPGVYPGHVPETVSLVGLLPTIMELAGFEAPHGNSIDGHSFADLADGKRPADPEGGTAFMAEIRDRSNPGGITAVVKGRWKLVSNNGSLELYDVHTDPGEHYNVVHSPAHAKPLAELKALLDERVAAGKRSPFP